VVEVSMIDNKMFVLRIQTNVACLKATIDESWLWHKKFGNLNFGSLPFMKNKNLVRGFPHSYNRKVKYVKVMQQGSDIEIIFLIIILEHMSL
jgi:hypothetical protein